MPFDDTRIELQGHKMIEASAGTGKTFSLAMLVLRTLIEPDQETGLKKILMVTFTNAAVAELEIRVRRFIREAYEYLARGFVPETEIRTLIDSYEDNGMEIPRERIMERLSNAMQSIDELKVMTIHSFCQETLKEFSFETNSAFDSDIITDDTELLDSVINEFWRKEIYSLGTSSLEVLLSFFDTTSTSQATKLRNLLMKALVCRLDNKEFVHAANDAAEKSIKSAIEDFITRKAEIKDNYESFVRDHFEEIQTAAKVNARTKQFFPEGCNANSLANEYYEVITRTGTKTIPNYFRDELLDLLEEYRRLRSDEITSQEFEQYAGNNLESLKQRVQNKDALNFLEKLIKGDDKKGNDRQGMLNDKFAVEYIRDNFSGLYAAALKRITSEGFLFREMKGIILNVVLHVLLMDQNNGGKYYPMVSSVKNARNHIGYDDMISRVHKSVHRVSEVLRRKYDVLFIDEFQDTDRWQYEIFSGVFQGKLAFFIGDPKQSIYGWRKADLNMYKTAREKFRATDPGSVEGMKRNFRSTPEMLEALNLVFESVENFFLDEGILYHEVHPGRDDMKKMQKNGTNIVPIDIVMHDENVLRAILGKQNVNKDDYYRSIIGFVASETERLLYSGEYTVGNDKIRPSEIGILVRSNEQARDVKAALSGKGVQAITLDDTRILDTPEAKQLYFVMTAVNRPSRKTINRALIGKNFGFTTSEELAKKKDEEILETFDRLRDVWRRNGIFVMLSSFIDIFGVRQHCADIEKQGGLRSLSNYYQLMELLHEIETRSKLNEESLVSWFLKAMSGRKGKNDEYVQRLESDEDAVKIVTIHKSKGLEYDVVFAPFLDLQAWTTDIVEYADPVTGRYFFSLNDHGENQERNLETIRQENRRLIYVALTRARYKCYINANGYPGLDDSSLRPIVESLKNSGGNDLIEMNPVGLQEPFDRENGGTDQPKIGSRDLNGIAPFIQSRDIHSFSSLSRRHDPVTSELLETDNRYDNFVFNELPRGAKAGLFLHKIFELLDFKAEDTYGPTIESAGGYYSTMYRGDHLQSYTDLVRHCMNAPVLDEGGNFILRLNEIRKEDKLPELEFYFSLDRHNKSQIVEIIPEVQFSTELEIEGVMHGFIDLLFRHRNGKYYILDWKSNFLGNRLQDYDRQGLEEGMRGSNYHLQYHIYTIAVKRYLEKKIRDFNYERDFGGVIYMFLRGVRAKSPNTGVFFSKPSADIIKSLERLF